MRNRYELNSELKGWVIDYERLNYLTAGELMENNMGSVNTKSLANRSLKKTLEIFNERVMFREISDDFDNYIIETLKYNKILVNIRKEKIKKILKDD